MWHGPDVACYFIKILDCTRFTPSFFTICSCGLANIVILKNYLIRFDLRPGWHGCDTAPSVRVIVTDSALCFKNANELVAKYSYHNVKIRGLSIILGVV